VPARNLYDRIAVIERIGGSEQLGERRLESLELGLQALQIGARQLRELGVFVGENLARLRQLALQALSALVGPLDGVELGVFATELFELRRIPRGGGVSQLPGRPPPPARALGGVGSPRISSPW